MSRSEPRRRRVAIACQGGGSHTAFTAGVLDRLLSEADPSFEVVGLSGTSGGAICAFATWFGVATATDEEEGRREARRLLERIWDDLAAKTPFDATANAVGVGTVRAQSMGLPVPTFSPYYSPVSRWSRDVLRAVLEAAVDPRTLTEVVNREGTPPPRLDLGAVDVRRGTFRTFTERDVTVDSVLASAAVPPLFRAAPVAHADGTTRWYWDGLFSQNPPLGDLFRESVERRERADELWIVRINPQREEDLPTSLEGIADRRNELGGNLSVNQELRFIRQLNEWHAEHELEGAYRPIEVKTIDLDESLLSSGRPLDYATKLDRSPQFLERLWAHGQRQAARFLAGERDRRRVCDYVEATWSAREARGFEGVTPDFEVHLPTSLLELRAFLRGRAEQEQTTFTSEEYVAVAEAMRRAFPDLQYSVEESVTEPSKVAIRWVGTGTHSGELFDVEPTGREVTLSGLSIYHLAGGRLSEAWVLSEQWSLLRQVDAAEPTASLGTASRVAATPIVTQIATPTENEDLARSEVEEVWNRGRRDRLDRLFADGCVLHLDDETDLHGRDAYWAFVRRYRDAFPDLTLTVRDTVSEGDKIVARLTMRGTHEGPFLGVDPTGREVDVDRMVIHHVDDGQVVETGVVEDTVRLLHQVGAQGK